ncbi:MAG: DUF4013 domain-containing protein [Polyangiales bacterium]|nr:DUF4013 domain-containing protein [Myxococcales bacterium]
MQLLTGYRQFFADPAWKTKALWGALFVFSASCIPFLGQLILAGWVAMAFRREARSHQPTLPARLEWDANYLMALGQEGLKVTLAALVWSLVPAVIVGVLCVMSIVVALTGTAFLSSNVAQFDADEVLLLFLFVIASIGIVLAQVVAVPAVIRVSLTGRFEDALRFHENLDMLRRAFVPILLGTLALMLLGFAATLVGLLLCGIGIYPAAVVATYAHAHFHHEVYRHYLAHGGAPISAVPPVAGAYADGGPIDAQVFT